MNELTLEQEVASDRNGFTVSWRTVRGSKAHKHIPIDKEYKVTSRSLQFTKLVGSSMSTRITNAVTLHFQRCLIGPLGS